MRLLSLKLRGAKGIYYGLGLEEIEIDFTQFDSGLIAVCGENGAGKTTLIENLQPFRMLHSRSGSLTNQFMLKDSCRDLRIALNGDEYRFFMSIDGESKNGKIESYVYRNGEPLNPDGKEGSYNEIVKELFGSPALFFLSLFMPQKRKAFYALKPAERKDLIVELIGDNGSDAKHEAFKSRADRLKIAIVNSEAVVERHRNDLAELPGNVSVRPDEIERLLAELGEDETRLSQELADLEAERDQLEERAQEQVKIKSELDAAMEAREKIESEVLQRNETWLSSRTRIVKEIRGQAIKVSGARGMARDAADMKAAKRTQLDEATEAQRAMHEQRLKKEYHDNLAHERDKIEREFSLSAQKRHNELYELDGKISRAEEAVAILEVVPCQQLESSPLAELGHHEAFSFAREAQETCSQCDFLINASRAKNELPSLQGERAKMMAADERELSTHNERISQLDLKIAEVGLDMRAYRSIEAEAGKYDLSKLNKELQALHDRDFESELSEAKARARELRTDLKRLDDSYKAEHERLLNQIPDLDAQIAINSTGYDPSIADKLGDIKVNINRHRQELQKVQQYKTDLEKELVTAKFQCDRHDFLIAQLSAETRKKFTLSSEYGDYRHLERAFGRNGGYQSCLIEAAGQRITPFANDLLQAFGLPWSMEIATLKPDSTGKKMVEGFYVFLHTPDGPRELSDLSGGQEVIIDAVIYHAVADMVMKQSGMKFETRFLDEADGALDEERAISYFRTIKMAHQHCGLNHTFVISHRPMVQKMIPQRINLVPGKGVVIDVD